MNITAHPVKFVKGSREQIEGVLMPFGGPMEGKDLDGEYFSDKTDFALDWYDARPLLYGHGKDADLETVPVGRITHLEIKGDVGGWMRAQLDKSGEYWEMISQLIDDGKLFLSSGAMGHLVRKDEKSGEILRWPVVEGSLTPTPANPLATVGYKDAERHFESAGLKETWEASPPEVAPPPPAKQILIPSLADSYEARIEDLNAAARGLLAPETAGYGMDMPEMMGSCYVVATFADHVIACTGEYPEPAYYQIPYKLDAMGDPQLGTPVEVTFTVARKAITYLEQSERTRAVLLDWYRRTKALAASWAEDLKVGRPITTRRRDRMAGWRDMMRQMADEVDAMLVETEPPKMAKAADARRLFAECASIAAEMAGVA